MNTLITTLQQQLALMIELRDLLKRETGELSSVNVTAMNEINLLKEDVSSRMSVHAAKVRSDIQSACAAEGLPSSTTLGELAARLGQKGNRDIVSLHARLNETGDQIRELLAFNREIAEKFAASLGNSLEFVSRIINQTSTYGASGSYQQRPAGSVLINREA